MQSSKCIGFAAGTAVWTSKGLVPIEQIKVGDMILSKAENNDGPQAYKPVANVIVLDNIEVRWLEAMRDSEKTRSGWEFTGIVATGDLSVWARHGEMDPWRWQRIASLDGKLELQDGSICDVSVIQSLMTFNPKEALVVVRDEGWWGRKIDLRNGAPIFEQRDSEVEFEEFDFCDSSFYQTSVYNLVVEDYHTYYVGAWGVWVHDSRSSPSA